MDTDLQKGCELHVHVGGCLYVDDIFAMGRDIYEEVDWSLFVESYEKAYGVRPDPVRIFADAITTRRPDLCDLRRHYVFDQKDGGDFGRFMAKFNLLICLNRHWLETERDGELVERIVERHRSEGLDYVEYRAMYMSHGDEEVVSFHRRIARTLRNASGGGLTARYAVSVPRWDPLGGLELVLRLLDESPELADTIVGIDFCNVEEGFPPKTALPLFERLERHNSEHPERSLEVLYHVGESFWDKSLESAVRWCHEAAELGVRRLGHATALGLDPAVAISRREDAHVAELDSERLDQIHYDLRHQVELRKFGVEIAPGVLEAEREELLGRGPGSQVTRDYSPTRLEEIRRRQDFVLHRLAESGTVVESCPTSNLRIGGVPDAARHPIHRFLRSQVNLVVGADDPGIFDSPLAAEIDWVVAHSGLDARGLAQRLGDPRRFRLGQQRPR
ncbi:MAG: hypothetical protein CME15_02125 [Gemmatimonadetes bacterium]|jgi:hypothetical protein|nr:hypothetical protein [Gemmatimonadota bacterium]